MLASPLHPRSDWLILAFTPKCFVNLISYLQMQRTQRVRNEMQSSCHNETASHIHLISFCCFLLLAIPLVPEYYSLLVAGFGNKRLFVLD